MRLAGEPHNMRHSDCQPASSFWWHEPTYGVQVQASPPVHIKTAYYAARYGGMASAGGVDLTEGYCRADGTLTLRQTILYGGQVSDDCVHVSRQSL